MAVSRSKILKMQVYTPSGKYVGIVEDIGFEPGTTEIKLFIKTRAGTTLTVDWTDVKTVGDIVILGKEVEIPKPATPAAVTPTTTPTTPTPGPTEKKICPYCGKPATWIPQYKRWYCYNCRKYI